MFMCGAFNLATFNCLFVAVVVAKTHTPKKYVWKKRIKVQQNKFSFFCFRFFGTLPTLLLIIRIIMAFCFAVFYLFCPSRTDNVATFVQTFVRSFICSFTSSLMAIILFEF